MTSRLGLHLKCKSDLTGCLLDNLLFALRGSRQHRSCEHCSLDQSTRLQTVDNIELASAVYACEHLHTRLLLVLGHTHCGAIKAALDGEEGSVAAITERIAAALGDVRDPYEASVANARAAVSYA